MAHRIPPPSSSFVFLLLLLVSFPLLSLATSEREPEEECKQRCRRELSGVRERQLCESRCEQRGGESDILFPSVPKECERQCRREGAGRGEKWLESCRRRCEEQSRGAAGGWEESQPNPGRACWERCQHESRDEKQRRRCERRCEEQQEGGRGGGSGNPEDPKRRCARQCGSDEECRRECERQASREKQDDLGDQKRENPYVWQRQQFLTKHKSEEGSCEMLPSFERLEILKGLQDFRVEKFIANPNTVVVPHHKDADSILYVCNGKGIVGIVTEEKQETFDIREGDVMVIPAGVACFAANTDEREKLCMVKILHTVSNTPGRVETFFGIGGEDQPSFFQTFSSEILEAAFNTQKDQLRKVFGSRKKLIMRASPEQLRELSRSGSEGAKGPHIWPFSREGRDCHRPYNLLTKRPWFSNRRGQIHGIDHNDYEPLKYHDITISFANISAGSMIAPAYNSRATKIAIVTKGSGYLEMACPHLSQEEEEQQQHQQQQQGTRYLKLSSELNPGTVFVEPAGHPLAIVANEDLHILCFDLFSRWNRKYMLAGKNNIYNNLQGVARELAFGSAVDRKESERILGAQEEEVIIRGPKRGGGRGYEDA